jgi:membrane-bound metal-dependent hydrolase YbcI (DUF457 family)
MPNAKAHFLGGIAAGVATGLLTDDKSGVIPRTALATLASSAGAKLPDLLEPAIHPNHRAKFHSLMTLAVVGYGTKQFFEWRPTDPLERAIRIVLLGLSGGYTSHLFMDMGTPKSLPLTGL